MNGKICNIIIPDNLVKTHIVLRLIGKIYNNYNQLIISNITADLCENCVSYFLIVEGFQALIIMNKIIVNSKVNYCVNTI